MMPLRFGWRFGGCWLCTVGTVLKKTLVRTLSGRHDGATTKKRVAMTAVIHSKNVSEFLLDAGIIAANQTLAESTRFEMSDEKWLAFQAALDQPVSAKPKLKKLLTEPGLLA